MDKQFWLSIKKNNYALPAGHGVLPLTEELFSYIDSTDPELRDIISFFVFKNWIKQGLYNMDDLRGFIPRLIANLKKGIGETENDFVFLRSFSALWLAVIVDYDIKNPSLRNEEMVPIKRAALAYLASECDLRGYDPIKGWAHAIDHAASLLAALADSPHTDANDHIRILDCIADKLKDSTHWIYIYDEDDCLAEPAVEVLARDTLSMDRIKDWLASLSAEWNDAFRDEERARAFFNGRNFLRALHWQMLNREDISNREAIQNILRDTLDQIRTIRVSRMNKQMIKHEPNTVILRDVIEADLPIFYEQQLDPEATQMAAFPSRDRDTFMAHWAEIMDNNNVTLKTILFENHVAGNIVSWKQSGEREVGYWIGKEYWGKGIGTKALAEFLGYVKTRPLYAHVARHNVASLRVLQKCGFTIYGDDKFTEEEGEDINEFILKLE